MGTVNITTAKKKNMGISWEVDVKATIAPLSGESVDPMSPTADILDGSGNVMHQCMLSNQSGNLWVSSTHMVMGEPANAKVRARFLSAEVPNTQAFVETAFAAGRQSAKPSKSKSKQKKQKKSGSAMTPPK